MPDKLKNNDQFYIAAVVAWFPVGVFQNQVLIFHCKGDISLDWRRLNSGEITEYKRTKNDGNTFWRDWCPGFYSP